MGKRVESTGAKRQGRRSAKLDEQRIQAVVDIFDGISYTVDARTLRATAVSRQAERILGYPLEQWTRNPAFLLDHTHASDRSAVVAAFNTAVAERRDHQFEFRMIAADGRLVWLRNMVRGAVRVDESEKVCGSMVDITEYRQAQVASRGIEDGFLALFERAPAGMVFLAMDGTIVRVNDALCSMLGYDRGALQGKNIEDLTHPDDIPVGRERRAAFERGPAPATPLQKRYIHRQGHVVWAQVASSAVRGDDGRVAYLVSHILDITDQKVAEERERQRSKELGALLNIATIVSQSMPFDQKVAQCLEEIVRVADVDWVTLRLPDDDGLRLIAAAGPGVDQAAPPQRLPHDEGAEGQAFREGSPVVTDGSVAVEGPSRAFRESRLAMPIKAEGQVLGVLAVVSHQERYFGPDRVRLLSVIANGVGPLLQNARLLESEQQRTKALEALFYLAGILVEPRSFEEKLDTVLQEIIRVTEARNVLLWIPEANQQGLRVVASAAFPREEKLEARSLPSGRGLASLAFQRGQAVVANTYMAHPEGMEAVAAAGIRSGMAIPVEASGKAMGALEVFSQRPEHFTPERVRLIVALTSGIGPLLENVRLYEQLREELDQNRRRLDAIWEVSGALALEQDPDQAVQRVVESARMLTGARCGVLSLWSNDGQATRWIVSPPGCDVVPGGCSNLESSAVLASIREKGERLRQAAAAVDAGPARPVPGLPSRSALLGAPVICRDRLRGGLYVTDKEDGPGFTADDEMILNVFATLAGVLLENGELYGNIAHEHATLAAIQESMAEGLVVFDADMRVVYCNAAAAALAEKQPAEILGATTEQLRGSMWFSFESSSGGHLGASLVSMLRGASEKAYVLEGKVHSPRERELALTVFPIHLGQGKRMAGVLVRDVTKERELERRRDTFVAVASHELRTPMTTIMGFVELLLKHSPPRETQRKWLELIHKDSLTLTSLIDDLLNVSRIQSGKLTPRKDRVSLRQPIIRAIEQAVPGTDKHTFVNEVPADMPDVVADEDKLVQVLVNLLSNAIKYSPAGGPICVSARHEPDRERVVLSVKDRGIGIAPDDQGRLFTTFERVRRPETEGIRGSGLGLYVIKAFVELMGGEVWLESALNSGSTFYFSLPAWKAKSPPPVGAMESKS